MSNIVNQIGYAMSLREPQKEALQYLDAISSNCDYKRNTLAEIESVATANCEDKHTIKVDDNFKFPSFCFDMATGIGKTRLMGAAIYYTNKDDKMAALHAKILAVDSDDVLISSANLSYHGMSGNIEIGTQVHSEKMVRQINELFKQLLFNKIFTEVKEYE